jgi:hypothetical protein
MLDKLLKDYLKTYMWLGGMPEVVAAWLEHQDPMLCQSIQNRIITAYQDDFLKYSKTNQVEYVAKLFNAVPVQLGKKFVYARIDTDIRTASLKQALELLQKANIIHQCFYSSGQKPPLSAGINEKFFKAFFLDIGLAQRLLGLEYKNWLLQPISIDNIGEITEQFVAQELIAYLSKHKREAIFYWQRDAKGSSAEIDFLISVNTRIFPIEVKAGKTGRLKSMRIYLDSHPTVNYGVKICEKSFEKENGILQIPFYAIETWLKTECN